MAVVTAEQQHIRRVRRDWNTRIFRLYAPLAIFVVVELFPFLIMFINSLKPDNELINVNGMPFWVASPTLQHYQKLLGQTYFLEWVRNSLTVTVVSTAISLVSGILAGYALARMKFRGGYVLAAGIFVTYLVPQTLLFLPLANIMGSWHLTNSLIALMLTYPTILIPFCTWMLMGYFRSIPKELEESAMIDGSSRLRALISIVLPLALPGILSAGIFAFTLSWNEYIYALVLTSDVTVKTVPVGVTQDLIRGDAYYWGPLMAAGLLGSVPVAIIYSFFVEHYVAGLTAGAMKG